MPVTETLFKGAAPYVTMEYQPGVCNIGPAEVAKRRRLAYAGLVVTVVFAVAQFRVIHPLVNVGLAVGLAMAFEGLLQVRLRFCPGFAQDGVFDLSEEGEDRHEVASEVDHRKDMRAAVKLHVAALAGTLVSYLVLSMLPSLL